MALSEILGLFTTPEQYQLAQQKEQQARAIQYANLDPIARANYGVYRAGQQLGGAIGGALGGVDPQLQKITQRQQLLGMIDPANPDSYAKAIQAALQTGDQEAAFLLRNEMMKVQQQAQEQEIRGFEREKVLLDRGIGIRDRGMAANALELSKGLIKEDGTVDETVYNQLLGYGDVGAKIIEQRIKATQGLESVQVQNLAKGLFNKDGTRNPEVEKKLSTTVAGRAVLKGLAPEKEKFVVVGDALVSESTGVPVYTGDKPEKYSDFARKLIEVGLVPGTEPFQKRMLEHINAVTKGASQGTGNVTIGGIAIDTGAAGKAAAKVIGENAANIESQFSLQTAIGDSLKLINQGIYAGAYGPEKGFVAKYSLGTIGDSKKVKNTEVFIANIGEIVIPRLTQFGGNDSNEELKYLQKVVAGDQRLEPESMKRILASAEKKVVNNIKRLQKQAESAGKGGTLPLEPIQPQPPAPRVTKRLNPQTGKLEPVVGE